MRLIRLRLFFNRLHKTLNHVLNMIELSLFRFRLSVIILYQSRIHYPFQANFIFLWRFYLILNRLCHKPFTVAIQTRSSGCLSNFSFQTFLFRNGFPNFLFFSVKSFDLRTFSSSSFPILLLLLHLPRLSHLIASEYVIFRVQHADLMADHRLPAPIRSLRISSFRKPIFRFPK